MKSKILGLLAVGLLAGPMAANASYIYTFTDGTTNYNYSFVLTTSSLIATQTFSADAFDAINAGGDVQFVNLNLSDFSIRFTETNSLFGFSGTGPVNAPGTYCGSTTGCIFSLTLRATSSVPEPGTLALLGLGLVGLGLSRRRKT